MRLSYQQRSALMYVGQGERPCGRRTTWHSLERLGLMEHVSTGWRLTPEGQEIYAELCAEKRNAT